MIAVVVDTLSTASDDPGRIPLHPVAAVASSAQAAASTALVVPLMPSVPLLWPRMGLLLF
ncbi:hypothetical protein GCM10010129_41580 [Streptomyces fumigatiscleroticus]|nr:hypothetical protein GCM10010129_41580 [Streptomyces fumigatiscleroticus]